MKIRILVLQVSIIGLSMLVIAGCKPKQQKSTNDAMKIKKEIVGLTDGKEVVLYTLMNSRGMTAKITNYGAIVTELTAPDKSGKFEDIVLGFDRPESYWKAPYINNCCYLGAIVGRYGNRVAKGKFSLNGQDYVLAINNGPNHLHGGLKGFDKVVWDSEPFENTEGQGVKLSYFSKSMEEGYPGNFTITVSYTLMNDNSLRVDYDGTIDQACPVNITHHGYFNLTGNAKTDILGHEMQILADRYTVVDSTLIPTGELRPVAGTPMDFTQAHTIGERIAQVNGGYDHNFVLSDSVTRLRQVVRVAEPVSGRVMEVYTTEPGVQFYSGNFLDGILTGKGNVKYTKHWGFCLETQHFPDSPNQPTFPSTFLEPGQRYKHTTVYKFGTL
ncbi:MAG: aldose epimerase family protein [Bacteroidales bacterium]|jgi:aldose 1-epimerase